MHNIKFFLTFIFLIFIFGCAPKETTTKKHFKLYTDINLYKYSGYVIFNNQSYQYESPNQPIRLSFVTNKEINKVVLNNVKYNGENDIKFSVSKLSKSGNYKGYYYYVVTFKTEVNKSLISKQINITNFNITVDDNEYDIEVNYILDLYYLNYDSPIIVNHQLITVDDLTQEFKIPTTIASMEQVILHSIEYSNNFIKIPENKIEYNDDGKYINLNNLNVSLNKGESLGIGIYTELIKTSDYGNILDYYFISFSILGSDEVIKLPIGSLEIGVKQGNTFERFIDTLEQSKK